MNREALDKWCERGILALVLAILVYGPLATGAVRTPDLLVIQGLTLAVLLLWILRLWLNPRLPLLWPPMCWAVLAFSVYAVARYLTADIEYVARQETVRVLIYAFLFFAIVNNLHRQEYTRLLTLTLVFLAMFISLYAVYQFVTDSDRVWSFIKPYQHRGSGTYISPNHLAGFLELTLPPALAWTLVSRARPVTKIFVGYAAFAILAGIAVSVSRGGWFSTGAALVVFFAILFFQRGYRLPSFLLLLVIVGAGLYFIPRTRFFQNRLRLLTANSQLEDDTRFNLWMPAIQLWRENPWWGIGPAHYTHRFRAYRPQSVQLEADRVHNDYLNALTDWGIVGTALVASAWALLGAGILKTWRSIRGSSGDFGARRSNKLALLLGASIGLLALLLHSAVDFNMHIPANAIVMVTWMALLSSCLRFATERYWVAARGWIKAPLTLLLVSGMVCLGWHGARRAREYAWLARAQNASTPSTRLTALERAFAVEPMNFETAYNLGEHYRLRSLDGQTGYEEPAGTAMDWYQRAIKLNPYHGYSYMRQGMCLDWVERPAEAATLFDRAVQLDPNGCFTVAHMGWHYVQVGDYAAARVWLERSLRLQRKDNMIAEFYLQLATRRLLESATNASSGPRL